MNRKRPGGKNSGLPPERRGAAERRESDRRSALPYQKQRPKSHAHRRPAVELDFIEPVLEDLFRNKVSLDKALKGASRVLLRDPRSLALTIELVRHARLLSLLGGGREITAKAVMRGLEELRPSSRSAEGLFALALELVESGEVEPAVALSIPDDLWALAEQELEIDQWEVIATSFARRPRVWIRANTLKVRPDRCRDLLVEEGIRVIRIQDEALLLDSSFGLFRTEAFKRGWFEQHDLNSQRVAALALRGSEGRVLDACAGNGGKTLALAALMNNKGTIVATDSAQFKLEELRRRARRAGVHNVFCSPDEPSSRWKHLRDGCDSVLIDAPCSGSGVLRRSPDAKWRHSWNRETLDTMAATQAEILSAAARAARPGGTVVFATCSIFPSEGEAVVRAVLAADSSLQIQQEHRWLPGEDEGDGFYAAVLLRQ